MLSLSIFLCLYIYTNTRIYKIRLLENSFLIAGILLLIYFQTHQSSFVGSPNIIIFFKNGWGSIDKYLKYSIIYIVY